MTLTLVTLKQTCRACPSQWEGRTTDGMDFFARYRHGGWRVDIDDVTVVSGVEGSSLDGSCSFEDLRGWASRQGLDLNIPGET